jgi:hypothetical protein
VVAIMLLTGSPESAAAGHARSSRFQPILTAQYGGFSAGVSRRWQSCIIHAGSKQGRVRPARP